MFIYTEQTKEIIENRANYEIGVLWSKEKKRYDWKDIELEMGFVL